MPTSPPTGEAVESCLTPHDAPFEESAVRDRLRDYPPSVKLVARTLADDAPLATGEIVDRSLLPARTARYALNRLDEAGLVESEWSGTDGRTQTFVLTVPKT